MRKPDTLRERAAQLIFPRLGSNMPPAVPAHDDVERVLGMLETTPVGGLVLFRGLAERAPEALQRLQEASRTPLLIAADLERGAGQQLAGLTVFPHAMAQGHAGEEAVEQAAFTTAAEARSVGVHWLFAPVADVHSNPANPIISTRAFGSEPRECGKLVAAFVRGARRGGGLSTAKHFPGHGDTDTDSHDVLPTVSTDRRGLDRTELVPFRAAIEAGVDAVMTAHVAYPALDPSGTAATFSAPILRTVLRDQLGFQGVVVSDSLLMGGAGSAVAARAPELVSAGVDVLLDVSHPDVALSSLLRAVADGSLPESLIHEAFERIWAMKLRVRGGAPEPPKEARSLARDIARRALVVEGALPSGRPPIVLIRPHTDYPDPTRADAVEILGSVGSTIHPVGPDTAESDLTAALEAVRQAGACVLVLIVKPAAWHSFGLLPWQARFAERIISDVPSVVCCLGSPDADRNLPSPAARVLAFSDVEVSVRAVADLLAAP